MKKVIQLTNELEREIKRKEREIDNPALVTSLLSELDFLKSNIETKK